MASELIKYVTAQDIAPQVQQLQAINLPEQIDMTTQAYEVERQNVHRAYETVRKAMDERTQTAVTQFEARGRGGAAAQLSGLANTIVEGVGIYQKIEAQKLEEQKLRQAELDKERQRLYDRDEALAKAAIQEQLLNMDGLIRQTSREEGIHQTRAAINRIINVDYANLPPEQRARLTEVYASTLMEEERRVTTTMLETQQANKDAQDAMRRSTLQLSVSAELTALTNPQNSPQTAAGIVSRIMNQVTAQTPDLSPQERVALISPWFNSVVEAYQVGETGRQQLMRGLNGMAGFFSQMQQYQEAGMLQNPNQAMIIAQTTATQFGVPELADNWLNDAQLTGQAVTYQQNIESLRQLQFSSQNRQLAEQAPNYLSNAALATAWNWLNEASPGDVVRAEYARAHPNEVTEVERLAVSVMDRWNGYKEEYHALVDRITQATQQQQAMAVRRDPGQLPPNTLYLDTTSGRYRRAQIAGEDMAIFLAPQVTEQAYSASVANVANLQAQLQTLVQRGQREGFDVTNPGNGQFIEQVRSQISAIESAAQALPEFRRLVGQPPNAASSTQSRFPNFSAGGNPQRFAGMPPVQALARTPDGVVLPLAAGRSATVTSDYGMRTHPIRGGRRMHHGIDISPEDRNTADVGAVALRGGTVINAWDWDGYGGTVMVRTPDGHVEQYSHLRRFFVKEGDVIPAGSPVGVIGGGEGDPMAGGSTGRHLHLQIWRAGVDDFGNPNQDTIPPLDYLRGINQLEPNPVGLGAPPNQPPGEFLADSPATMQVPAGSWISSFLGYTPPWLSNPRTGMVTPVEQVYTETNPIPQVQAPIHRSAYPERSNPNANYGYGSIARDPEFARNLARVADNFNIPAQWLADVMAFESTTNFDPNRENSIGAIGLIQVIPETYRALGLTRDQIMRMNRTQYLQRVVVPYLEEFRGKLHTIEDVLAAVFGGNRLHRASPRARANIGDGNITFANYVRRLGNTVGRRYRTSYDAAQPTNVHTTPQPGCAMCQQMYNRFHSITPHEAP